MDVLALTAKALLAVMLVVAGSAKMADLENFSATVRLFVPLGIPWVAFRSLALGIVLAELTLGVASLSWPIVGWLNPLVFTLACGLLAVSGAGYIFHRGRSCRCFGALSRRKFDGMNILRSIAIVALAAFSMSVVRPALFHTTPVMAVLLTLASAVVAIAAFTAAKTLGISRKFDPEMR